MLLCCFSVFSCLGNPFRDGFAHKNLLSNVFVLFECVLVFRKTFRDGFADKNLPSDVFVLLCNVFRSSASSFFVFSFF